MSRKYRIVEEKFDNGVSFFYPEYKDGNQTYPTYNRHGEIEFTDWSRFTSVLTSYGNQSVKFSDIAAAEFHILQDKRNNLNHDTKEIIIHDYE
jgi:hypothetical protein